MSPNKDSNMNIQWYLIIPRIYLGFELLIVHVCAEIKLLYIFYDKTLKLYYVIVYLFIRYTNRSYRQTYQDPRTYQPPRPPQPPPPPSSACAPERASTQRTPYKRRRQEHAATVRHLS